MRILLPFFLLLVFPAFAQKIPVQIRVVDSKDAGIEYATVFIFADSTNRIGNITDSTGLATFSVDSTGKYFLKISAPGYKPIAHPLDITGTASVFHFSLANSGSSLREVVVTRSKPLMRQEDDKTIIDPDQLAEASSNIYEVLEKTPGLFIDQDGNIYLSSTTPATVYINGRELKMSRSDVAAMLKSMPPNSIERIEIMRTPSAKYDASGSGGVVNVVLKKGVKLGLNGAVTMGAQQGTYGNQNIGFNLSDNQGSSSTYLSVNFSGQNNYQQLNTNRVLIGDTSLNQKAFTTYPGKGAFANFGYNKDLNTKWNIGYDARVNYNKGNSITGNINDVVNTAAQNILGSTRSDVNNNNQSVLTDLELSSKYKIDSNSSEWNNRLSYTFSSGNTEQDYHNSSILGNTDGNGTVRAQRHYIVVQSDLNKKLVYHIAFETGVKSSWLAFQNNALYFTGNNAGKENDYSRTNKYRYSENINAAYLQGSKSFSGFILKTGLRLENTNMEGVQIIPGDTAFNIHRTDLFPYVYFSKKLLAIAGYDIRAYLVYRRTINRPSYEQLNPYPKYVDQFMSEIGNPNLKPQFTQNYEANISARDHPLFAIGYNDTKDMFTNVFYQADSTVSQAYRGYDNIGTNKEIYLRGLAAIPPGKRYFAIVGAQYNRNVYEGFYEGKPLHFSGENWLFFTYQQLKLDKKSTLTLNAFWRLAGPMQFYELTQMGSLNAGINRKFLKDKITLSINVNDLFYTNNNRFVVKQGSVDANGSRATDSRRYGFSLRYNFGIHKKDEGPDMFGVDADGKK